MAPEQLQAITPLIAAAFLALALLLFLASLRMFRKSRTDFYWRRRRAAGQRGWRMFVLSIGITLLSGVLCVATGLAGILYARPTPTVVLFIHSATATTAPLETTTLMATTPSTPTDTATAPATFTVVVASRVPTIMHSATSSVTPITPTTTLMATTLSPTATPTALPSATATLTATLTETPTATFTPSATDTPPATPTTTSTPSRTATPTITPTQTQTLKPALVSTTVLESSVTPGANASISITAISTQISGDFGPVDPATTFKAGFSRVYFFVNFSGMQSGVLWRRELIFNDQVIQRLSYLWGREQDGNAYFFFGQEGGFKTGKYEIRVFIGESEAPAAVTAFTVN